MSPAVTYVDGWYDDERDGKEPFRWTGRSARCRIHGIAAAPRVWLRVLAGHASPGPSPVLTVSVNGRVVGQRTIAAQASHHLFPVGEVTGGIDGIEVALALDRTFNAPGDPRDLGILVWAIDVVAPDTVDADGWYGWEDHEYFRFRWTRLQSVIGVPATSARFAAVPVGSDMEAGSQILSVVAGGEPLPDIPLLHGWHLYDLALPPTCGGPAGAAPGPGGRLALTFRVNCLTPADLRPEDPRELGIRIGEIERHDDARRHGKNGAFYEAALGDLGTRRVAEPGAAEQQPRASSEDPRIAAEPSPDGVRRRVATYMPEDGEGWHAWEVQDVVPFRWMKDSASLTVPGRLRQSARFCTIPVFSEFSDLSQVLTIAVDGHLVVERRPARLWTYLTVELPAPREADVRLSFRLNKLVPAGYHPDDPRPLGLRVGPLRFHDEEAQEPAWGFAGENAAINQRELDAGATVLESFPVNLGIDLYGKCNIKPACVYCAWDEMKALEGDAVNAEVDDRTLVDYGPFFHAAQTLTNCSFGEPLLHPRIGAILDLVARHDKMLELATNGQAFTPSIVRALAGKPVLLYVSLDAASAETYARLRNDRWHEILAGLTCLREARRRSNGLPKLQLVFMPMRANLHDLEAFFRLCRMVDADSLALRPLNHPEGTTMIADRGGYHFDYASEMLSREEIEEVFRRCETYAERYGVFVANQYEFGMPRTAKPRQRRRCGRGT